MIKSDENMTRKISTINYLSNKPQVCMVYRLINVEHEKNLKITSRRRMIYEFFDEVFYEFFQSVVYQPINRRNLWSIAFI